MVKRQNASTGEFVDEAGKSGSQADAKPTMRLRVQAPFKTYYDDDVYSISAVNDTGPFDVLPKHHNFISILRAGTLDIVTKNSGHQKIIISGGLMRIESDQVVVFLDV